MEKGQILIYRDNNLYIPAEFVEEKNDRFRIETENGKMFFITKDKVFRQSGEKLKVSQFIDKSNLIAVNVSELWEDVHELSESFTAFELSELFFGGKFTDCECFSLINSIQNNPVFFEIRGESIFPLKKEAVEKKMKEIKDIEEEKERKIERRKEAFSMVVGALKENKVLDGQDDGVVNLLAPLKEYCIQQDEYSKKDEAVSLYKEIAAGAGLKFDGNADKGIFNLLTLCGVINNPDELIVRRYGIKTSFSGSALSFFDEDDDRADFRDHHSFTIDSEDTKDIDDGLSMKVRDDGFDFYIHIADPDSFVKRDSPFDKEAFSKGTSVYLVSAKYPMFPRELSFDSLSLVKGADRNALTMCISTDKDYKILNSKFMLSKINIKSRLSYHSADNQLEEGQGEEVEFLNHFKNFSLLCRKKREDSGALMLDYADLSLTVDESGKVMYDITFSTSFSQIIVQEMMILFNKNTAEYCIVNSLPSIFISQESPAEPVTGKRSDFTRAELQSVFPKLKKSVIGVNPGPHYCMGLSYYTQATSPIRRYLDLTVHRIIKSSLKGGQSPFDEDELRKIAATISSKALNASKAEKESIRFWSLKYIEQNINDSYKALVLKRIPGGVLCELDNLLLRVSVTGNEKVNIYDTVEVRFKDVFPYTGDVKASYSVLKD